MPYFAMPKNINELIMRKRVVLNEDYIYEFVNQSELNMKSSTTLTPLIKRPNSRLNDASILTSPRNNNNNNNRLSTTNQLFDYQNPIQSQQHQYSNQQYQQPLIANYITSNPFYDNKFPVNTFQFLLFNLINN